MDPPTKLLFVCSRNQVRSKTAEELYTHFPGYEARSAGTQPEARIKVTEGQLGWADVVVCMEKAHLQKIRKKYPEAMAGKDTVVLHLPDDFAYGDPALTDELPARLSEYFEVPEV